MFFLADGHCDTLTRAKACGKGLNDFDGHVNIEKLLFYAAPVQLFAIWYDRGEGSCYRKAMDCIEYFYQEVEKNSDYICAAFSADDIERNIRGNKITGLLALEGGDALEGSLANLRNFYRLGVRAMGLTWNHANELGDGAMVPQAGGLTEFGVGVVQEMNLVGMIVDVSHLSERGFWDVCEVSRRPFVASHSNCRAICPHPRNLHDRQIRAIAERGGIIGVNLYAEFLRSDGMAGMEDIVLHAERIINIGSEDCIGLGCDFDGMDALPDGILGIGSIERLYGILRERFGWRLAEKIVGGNWLAFLKREL